MITDAKYVAERDRRVALLDKLIEDTRAGTDIDCPAGLPDSD